jgi:hypothetical protein
LLCEVSKLLVNNVCIDWKNGRFNSLRKKSFYDTSFYMKKQLLLFCFLFSLNNAAYSNSKIQKFKNSSNLEIQAIQKFKQFKNSNPQKKHPFHVSKFDIVYNSKEKTWQITGHIFIDDLESALRKQGIDKLFLCSNKETAQAQEYVVRYLKQHFSIEINEKRMEWTFLGKETSDDLKAMWCYMEIKSASVPQTMVIKNNVLTEVFGDQKNMISVTDATQQKSYSIFTAQKTKEIFF